MRTAVRVPRINVTGHVSGINQPYGEIMETTNSSAGYRALSRTPALTTLDWIALILMIIGGINWGLVGAFNLDLVQALLGSIPAAARVVYILVGLAGIYGIVLLVRLGRRD
jgi:uncharacterized membrane protein YuzA (DUF378 family)